MENKYQILLLSNDPVYVNTTGRGKLFQTTKRKEKKEKKQTFYFEHNFPEFMVSPPAVHYGPSFTEKGEKVVIFFFYVSF